MTDAPLAAVTGATGFLGRQIVRALHRDGWRVRVLARRDPIDPLWRDLVPEVVLGDLSSPAALARLCAGADTVIHNAGLVKARSRAEFDAVNVEGALKVAEAAAAARHVVLVSSLAAREPQLSDYAASKRVGEAAMAQVLGPRLSVARPPAIYGPGDRELLPVFQAAARSPLLPRLDASARLAMIHVEDAAAQIAALARGDGGRIVALSDSRPDGYGWDELMATAAAACGRNPLRIAVPGGVLLALGITNGFASLLGVTPMLTLGKARELLHPDWTVTPQERLVGAPDAKYDLLSGFSQTVAWYRSAAWMKH